MYLLIGSSFDLLQVCRFIVNGDLGFLKKGEHFSKMKEENKEDQRGIHSTTRYAIGTLFASLYAPHDFETNCKKGVYVRCFNLLLLLLFFDMTE